MRAFGVHAAAVIAQDALVAVGALRAVSVSEIVTFRVAAAGLNFHDGIAGCTMRVPIDGADAETGVTVRRKLNHATPTNRSAANARP